MNCFDVYRLLDAILDRYLDSIALIEDPTERQRKDYDMIKFWRPSKPDVDVENILKSIILSTEHNGEEK